MTKTKTPKSKQQKKNLMMQIIVVVILIASAAYFIISNFVLPAKNTNTALEQALNNKAAYSFTKEGELSFTDNKGDSIAQIDVEIADDDEQRSTGLMFRDKMSENQGMLFLFDSEIPQAFWMKNTILPLDIIFVNAKMEIVKIHKNAEPYSEKSLPSEKPSQFVVEVNAGYCEKFGIKEGDKIVWRRE